MSLILLSLLAIAFVAWPLLRQKPRNIDREYNRQQANVMLYQGHLDELDASRSQGELDESTYEQLKAELGRSLLEDNQNETPEQGAKRLGSPVLLACLLLVPLVSFSFYLWHGAYDSLELRDLLQEQSVAAMKSGSTITGPEVEATKQVVAKLKRLLEKDPDNLQNRYLLARNLLNLQDLKGAIGAYQEILSRSPKEPQILAEFGQVIFMASGSQMLPQVQQLADSALALDPQNTLALSLAGITAYEKRDYPQALTHWTKAVSLLGANNPDSATLLAGIANIEKIVGRPAREILAEANPSTSSDATSPTAGEGLSVTINVALANGIEVDPNLAVFVYARAWQGPKMPLAIQRMKVSDLPTRVTLTESMAMMAGMSIATVDAVELIARVSLDGSPTTKPGDWQASVGPVSKDAFDQAYNLTIETKVQ
ncbi:c-type cytochrome biogenesis protein CcmI [Halioxenophilus sp. WMMB6]|uniref:c-type cytochrome biogenesis protein CcmI n=1 Tax=Halioxenophilus sp. WMMB6 TaxID=3073815 RepID=UPI00295ED9AF|nr:c-type cytochrome biogenesis protein CcmI [Halioxenophilus sp. WMMB6]